jgi:predicted Zn-dependent protease
MEPTESETRTLIRTTELAEAEIAREISDEPPNAPPPAPSEHEPVHAVPAPLAPAAGRFRWRLAAAIIGGAATLLLLVMWLGPGRPAGELDEAIALFRTGAGEQALPHFRSHAESNPDDATAWLYIARIHRRGGRLPEARDAIRAGFAAAPADAGLQSELGYVLLDGGQAQAAVPRFRDAVARAPEAPEAWIGLVRALRETGDDAAAARVLSRAPPEVRALLGSSPS